MKNDVTKTHTIKIDDVSEFLSSVGKTLYHVILGKVEELPVDAMDIGASLGLATTEEKLVWKLIDAAMLSASKELMGGWPYSVDSGEGLSKKVFIKSVNKIEYQGELVIDSAFFASPAESQITEYLQQILLECLTALHINRNVALNIADRFPSYFVYALHQEWSRNTHLYNELYASINTPFANAVTMEKEWYVYTAWLEKQINKNVFDESFSLMQIYIPLDAYYIDHSLETAEEIGQNIKKGFLLQRKRKKAVVVNIEQYLDYWLRNGSKDDALKIISGGPGSGKSTFTKIYAAHVSKFMRVIHIPLYLLDLSISLEDAIERFLKRSEHFSRSPLHDSKNLLLIFDGLDEIAQMGRASYESAHDFIIQIEKLVNTVNISSARLHIVVSGREILLQSLNNRFRRNGQILHMIPYCLKQDDDLEYKYKNFATDNYGHDNDDVETDIPVQGDGDMLTQDEINRLLQYVEDEQNNDDLETDSTAQEERSILTQSDIDMLLRNSGSTLYEDRRMIWWDKYEKITGYPYNNKLVFSDELFEITNQPLLNYLFALTLKENEDTEQINLNDLYENMINKVYSNVHNANRNSLTGVIDREDFDAMLEEIAVSVWQNNTRTTTYEEIERRCEKRGLTYALERFGVSAEQGVTNLMLAFYFRNTGIKEARSTFEFTHKSFEEYLSARSIVSRLFEINASNQMSKRNRYRATVDDMALLWIEYYAKSPITYEIDNFLRNEIARYTLKEALILQEIIGEMFSHLFKYGMPFEKMASMERPSHIQEQKQDRNVEENLLAAYCACAGITKRIISIQWPYKKFFKEWVSKLNQNDYSPHNLVNKMFGYLDLRDIELNEIVLKEANFTGSDLTSSNMSKNNLGKADMRKAILRGTNLANSDMEKIDLSDSLMEQANLTNANLHDADLTNADLTGATLINANLYNACLKEAVLCGCDLRFANLIYVDFTGADLRGADLFGADLRSAVLTGAQLHKKQMENAIVNEAVLKTLQ